MKFKESPQKIQFKNYKKEFNKDVFSALLNSKACSYLVNEHCWSHHKNNLYNPLTTLALFIQQVLSSDKSCKNTVSGMVAQEAFEEGIHIGSSSGAYVKARKKLPPALLYHLVKSTGTELIEEIPEEWKTLGRPLKGFDGTTLTMADTPENRSYFPKHSNQKKNIGFPLARLVALMSLETGTVLDYSVGPCVGKGTGESSLLRTLLTSLEPNDIVVADRYYPHFFLLWDLKKRGVDGVFRAAAQRRYDFRRGKRLGSYDHIAIWTKPRKPDWMSREEYRSYPDTMPVREFKGAGAIYVTTLLEPKAYPKERLISIYKRRWEVETNLDYIKTVMEMNHLTSKTPEMVKKEISVHFLAYNLIRNLMAKAAMTHQLKATQISFKGTVQLLNQFTPLIRYSDYQHSIFLTETLLLYISKNRIANRPGRSEPRAVKRRPKTFPILKGDRKSYFKNNLPWAC